MSSGVKGFGCDSRLIAKLLTVSLGCAMMILPRLCERSISRSRRPRGSIPCAMTKRSVFLKSIVMVIWPGASDSARAEPMMSRPPDSGGISGAICVSGLTPQSASGATCRWTCFPSFAGTLVTKRIEQLKMIVTSA